MTHCFPILSLAGALALGAAPAVAQQYGGTFYEDSSLQIQGEIGEVGFGFSMAIKDDSTGDGIDDILIGAPGKNLGTGGVYFYDRALLTKIWLINGPISGGRFGTEVATLGDMNGDGRDEFIVSAPGENNFTGAVYVFDGAVQTNYVRIPGENIGDNFGEALEILPDMNGDGYNDFAVGADIADDGIGIDTGMVVIYSGKTRAEIRRFYGPLNEARFGSYIAELGDIDGDQITDLCIGCKGAEVDLGSGPETDVGRAFVLSGADGDLIHTVAGEVAYGYFGSTVAKAGDVNNDGVPDFIVAAQEYSDAVNGMECGAVYVYSGADRSLLRKHVGEAEGDKFGGAVVGNVDVNMDGRLDMIIGAPIKDLSSTPDSYAGAFYVISGTGKTILKTVGDGFRERRGTEIEFVGDTNGNGIPEFYVSSPEWRPPNIHPRVGRLVHWEFDPYLYADNYEISATAGATINYDIKFPSSDANFNYLVLISGGQGPSFTNNGIAVPLSTGNLFYRSLNGDYNFLSSSVGMQGTLDGNAEGSAQITQNFVPAGLVGKNYYVAAITVDGNGVPAHSSANRRIVITP